MTRLALAACLGLLFCSPAAAQGKNILLYGNSYSAYHGGVGAGVRLIAEAAGLPSPNVYEQYAAGQTLTYHATDPGQVAAITSSLPPGQKWDAVVIQGQSLEATATLGSPTQFRARAGQITGNVLVHSPNARAVLFQTWARAQGHFLYPGTYATPLDMHAEIRDGYRLAADDIDAAHGAGTAALARVGDAVSLVEFQRAYYEPDLFHPSPKTTLLASMSLFTSIYDQRVCELQPNLSASGSLLPWLAGMGLSAADWRAMMAIADRCTDPSMRPFAGSSDQLLLESGSPPGPTNACGLVEIGVGSFLVLQLSSRNGVYDQAPAWLIGTLFVNGVAPNSVPAIPELHVDPTTMLLLQAAPNLQSPITIFAQMPLSLPGLSVLVQGVSFAPSGETGNTQLTTTDGHVLKFK